MDIQSAAIDTSATMLKASQAFSTKKASDLVSAKDSSNMAKVEEAAKQFEAVFISEMLKPMFDGLKTDGMFGGGKGEEIFRGMMLDQYGKQVAENGGIGIASHVKDELLRIQSTTQKTKAAA